MSSLPVYENGLVLSGYHKKLKTMRKKFFVLYKETPSSPARLEYFDNEKKFNAGSPPKRVIKLKNCFNINRRLDTKYNFVISLSSREGAFGIVLESEVEMKRWLDMLISLQRCNYNISESLNPTEHTWQVIIQKRGLAEEKALTGNYVVRLTSKSVLLVKTGLEAAPANESKIISSIEFYLTTIRRCGDSQCYFYMEVGRQSIIGPGELWMKTEDSSIAQHMHRTILSAMSIKTELFVEPMRKRSSSANETSKPMNVIQRKHTQQENKCNNSPQPSTNFLRERSDSLPSKKRSVGDYINPVILSANIVSRNITSTGKHSFSQPRCSSSPPINYNFACSESEESSISLDETEDTTNCLTFRFNSRSSDGIIIEENNEDFHCSDNAEKNDNNSCSTELSKQLPENYVTMAPVKSTSNVKKSFHNISEDFPQLSYFPNHSNVEFLSEFVKENGVISQFELPTRAYSVGSRVEHNRMKRVGSAYECEHRGTRIRAFSVGSRSKLCRNDPQREPNSIIEYTCNSNNNIIYKNDSVSNNPISYANMNKGIKSTSAPLLHKSHSSVERMGDLMEIDFSKNNQLLNRNSNKTDMSKCEPSPRNSPSTQLNSIKQTLKNDAPPVFLKSENTSENGYLEMKPVGEINNLNPNSINYYPMNFSDKVTIGTKLINISSLQNDSNVDKNYTAVSEHNKIIDNVIVSNNHQEMESGFKNCYPPYNSEKNKCKTIPHKMATFDEQSNLISSTICQVSNINLNGTSQLVCTITDSPNIKHAETKDKTDFSCNDKLYQSINSNESKSLKSPRTDYEILERKANKNRCQTSTQKLHTNKSSKSISANSLNSECNNTEKEGIYKLDNDVQIKNDSRPSSMSSEHKLYYASLDLPQCSSQTNTKIMKVENNSSPPIIGCNEYAKIDFEHSDSSSSSSKNLA